MMTREDRQEALSLAYVHAVAATVGMTHARPFHDYGIDLTLHEIAEREQRRYQSGFRLDIQLKSSSTAVESRTHVTFDLPIKAYDDLRTEADYDRILVLFVVSADGEKWVKITPRKLELHGSAYWLSLRGRAAVRYRSSIRVAIPRRQRFTSAGLREIIQRVRGKEGL